MHSLPTSLSHIIQKKEIISWDCRNCITMTIIVHDDFFIISHSSEKKNLMHNSTNREHNFFFILGDRVRVIIKQTSNRIFLSTFYWFNVKKWESRIKIEKTLRIEFSLSSLTVVDTQLHVVEFFHNIKRKIYRSSLKF